MIHIVPAEEESIPHDASPNCFCTPERQPDGKWMHFTWDGLPDPDEDPDLWHEIEGEDD